MIPANAGLHVRFRGAQRGVDGVTMRRADALVSTHQRRHRHTLRGGDREIPGGAVFGRMPAFAARARLRVRGLDADQLVAGDGMLTLREAGELRLIDRPLESPRGRESAVPFAQNLLALAVVVLADVAELLVVIALGLTGAERFGHRHHGAAPPRLVETRMAVPAACCGAAAVARAAFVDGRRTAGAAAARRNRTVPIASETGRGTSAGCRSAA